MKQLKQILLTLFAGLIILSCKREVVEEKVNADFSYEVADSNYSVPVRVLFINKSSGAQQYKWTFEGAEITGYDQKEPGVVSFTKVGTFQIKLEAWKDQLRSEKIITITFDSVPKAAFTATPLVNNFGVSNFIITNLSAGGLTQFSWSFPGGTPSFSLEKTPAAITYTAPGEYRIFLEAKNSRGKKDTISKTIKVLPALNAGFEIVPSFDDEDYEAPLTALLKNSSVSATKHLWQVTGGVLSSTTDSTPTVTYTTPGNYTVTYTAGNGKDSVILTRTIIIKPNTLLRTFSNIKLGINTAQSTIGNYFSSSLRRVITKGEVDNDNGPKIDIAFYGLSASFNYNLFVSPDEVQAWTFAAIPGASNSKFINSQEMCGCGLNFTSTDFENISNGNQLISVRVNITTGGSSQFDNGIIPRVVLFENADGKKGVIKIKQYVQAGLQSHIVCDIKIQKD